MSTEKVKISNGEVVKNIGSLEIRKGETVHIGDFYQMEDKESIIEVINLEAKDFRNLGLTWYVSIRVYNLSHFSVFDKGAITGNSFRLLYKNAILLSKERFEELWKKSKKPLPESKQDEIISEVKEHIKTGNLERAKQALLDYFNQVVIREPEKIKTYFLLRFAIPKQRFRPCFCLEYVPNTMIEKVYEELPKSLFEYIPKDLIAKPRKLSNRANYAADPENKDLKDLINPFVSTDSFQISMLGISFGEKGTAATDAHLLFYSPKVKKGKKGVYCMTKKCFKNQFF